MHSIIFSLMLCAALGFNGAIAAERIRCPERVRIGFHDFNTPGFLNGKGPSFESPPGKLIDWTRAAVAAIPCKTELEMVRMPLHRVILETTEGNIHINSLVSPIADNLSRYALPMRKEAVNEEAGYFYIQFGLYKRKGDDSVRWEHGELYGPTGFTVGALRDLGPVKHLAKKKGWMLEPGDSSAQNLNKLIAGRMSALIAPEFFMQSDDIPGTDKLELLQTNLLSIWFTAGANKQFYATYPEFMQLYWRGICRLARAEQKPFVPCRF